MNQHHTQDIMSSQPTAAQAQVAFMAAHKDLSMAEKLRLWKAQKAKPEGASATAAAAGPKAASTKAAAAPTTAATTTVAPPAPATRKPLVPVAASQVAAPVLKQKRAFGAVTTHTAVPVSAKSVPISSAAAAAVSKPAVPSASSYAINTKRAKTTHKSTTAVASSAQSTPATSAQPTPASSTHTSPQQPQQAPAIVHTVLLPSPAKISATRYESASDQMMEDAQPAPIAAPAVAAAAAIAAPATPPHVAPAPSSAAFTTPIASSLAASLAAHLAPASAAATPAASAFPSAASSFDNLNARLQAWRAERGVQLTATAAKARVADEKRRHAQEVKASIAQAAAESSAAASTPALSRQPHARTATPSVKHSSVSHLSIDSTFSRIQSLMRHGAWSEADKLVSGLVQAGGATAKELESRAEVWVCRAYIAEQLGRMEQVVSLYDAARHSASFIAATNASSAADAASAAFADTIHRGFHSFMCRFAGVEAKSDVEKQPKVLDQFLAPAVIDEAAAAETDAAEVQQTEAEPAATDAMVIEEVIDPNEDLGVSFTSVGGASAHTTPHLTRSAQRSVTPLAASLRASMMGEFTPGKSLIGNSFTPRSERLRADLRNATPSAAAAATTAMFSAKKASLTPAAASLAAQLQTLSPEAASLASLRSEHTRIAASSASRSATRASMAAAATASARKAERLLDALSPALSSPSLTEAASPSLSDASPASNPRRESLPLDVARTLFTAEDDALNMSSASLGAVSPAKDSAAVVLAASAFASAAAMEFLDASMTDVHADEEEQHEQDQQEEQKEQAVADLFQEDEFIPGLSTPAVAPSARHLHLASSPLRSAIGGNPTGSPTRPSSASKRMLTPSKASLSHSHVLEGSNVVVLASVRAHPRDAARLGSATFLSPVRRSGRKGGKDTPSTSVTTSSPALDSLDQASFTKLLEQNNFAYHANPALGLSLTPIPLTRVAKATPAAMEAVDEEEEEMEAEEPKHVASKGTKSASRQATPMPSARSASMLGASVVVLQPVRSRSARRGSNAAFSAVDPRSDEYLLSPVRRSSRHTAPQSLSELTHLLTHTKYAYKANPLLDDDVQLLGGGAAASPAAAAHYSTPKHSTTAASAALRHDASSLPATPVLAAIREDDEKEESVDEADADGVDARAERAAKAFEEELQMQLDAETDAAAEYVAQAARVGAHAAAFDASIEADPSRMPEDISVPSSSSVRVSTPMPFKKTAQHMPVASSSSSSSTASSSSMQWDKSDEFAATQPTRSSSLHEKDAEGFFVPLPPSRAKSSSASSSSSSSISHSLKRKHSMDDLEEKLSAVGLVSGNGKRQATPRPIQTKKQRIMHAVTEDSSSIGSSMQRVGTPMHTRRSSRVATPMH